MAKKLVLIAAVWPEPKSSAGGARLMQLLKYFQTWNYQIIYCCTASKSEYSADLGAMGIETKEVPLNDSAFDLWIKEVAPEVVIFDRFMVEEQFSWRVREACPQALRIVETIDLHCLRKARQKKMNSNESIENLLLQSDEAYREIAAILRSDLSLIISREEMKLLQSFFKVQDSLLHYLPYEAPVQLGSNPAYQERQNFLSIGNFKHPPNWDAVLWLKKEIWPLIRKELPQARLHVCGAYPDEKVYQLHSEKEGFLIKGRVPDALEEMKKARVLLAPLRFGAGIKGKLVESLICGTPNVTTEVGIEGISSNSMWNGFIAESAIEIAQKAVELYSNENVWFKCQEIGFTILEKNFATASDGEFLVEKIEKLKANLPSHRAQNFYGNLLQYHQFQSSKYLSKWIEEKNKAD